MKELSKETKNLWALIDDELVKADDKPMTEDVKETINMLNTLMQR